MNSGPCRTAQQTHAKGMAVRRMILSDAHDNEDDRARAPRSTSTDEQRRK